MRFFLLLAFLIPYPLFAQSIKGKIFGQTPSGNEILPGATLTLLGTSQGAVSNEFGVFEINVPATIEHRLIVSFLGFKTDCGRGANLFLRLP